MRLRNRLADRVPDDLRRTRNGLLGNREELALGLTLMIVVIIAGNEIAHLMSPWAAILTMFLACLAGGLAYERAT